MKTKQIEIALSVLKNAKEIQCVTLDDNTDIEMNFFDPNVDVDQEIPELVIGGLYGNVFTDDLLDSVLQDNTITTKQLKITIIK
jgi:hypothetical protein